MTGFRLVPGRNVLPAAYVRDLEGFEVPEYNGYGGHTLVPLFESLGKPGPTSGGKAQIVVLGPINADAEEGPEPPLSLTEYADVVALKLVEVTTNKDALKRWSKDKRPAVAEAAKAKVGR